jgi:hypothetical protein
MNFCMVRFLKKMVWVVGCVLGCQSAFGFALLGPVPNANTDDFEVPALSYALGTGNFAGGNSGTFSLYPGDDPGTPKLAYPNEGYRRNTPVMYYAFDPTFLNFFGPGGAAEVDKAVAYFNDLTNVSAYSPDLSEFPLDSRRVNFRASAESLLDLKSVTMGLMTEQLGFFQPVRWIWDLSARVHLNGPIPCPGLMEYTIVKRNYDIVPSALGVYQTSSYVNDVLYSYAILEACTGTPLADAAEFPVDPLASPFSAVADYMSFEYVGCTPGTFYTGLTRDDAGALRFLLQSNNVASEAAGARVIEFETNTQPAIITNQDLNLFAARALTNGPAALTALYPGLVINAFVNTFTNGVTTNIAETLTNAPLDPAGFPPTHPLFVTNFTTNVVTLFHYTFGNVVTNAFSTRGLVGKITLAAHVPPLAPAGTPPTLTTNFTPTLVNGVFGGFFILPTNFCGAQVLSALLSQVIATTNFPSTNILAGSTNAVIFTPGSVTFFTNQTLVILPVSCPTNVVAVRQGMERVRFERRDFDPLLGQLWDPITNDYTAVELNTNTQTGAATYITRHLQRRVPKPDFLFATAHMNSGATTMTYSNTVDNASEILTVTITGIGEADAFRTVNFNETARSSHAAGPGTIQTPDILSTLLVFNDSGPFFVNTTTTTNSAAFIGEATQFPLFAVSWGSFDGSTNDPTVYPNGTSILDLEQALLAPAVSTSFLQTATVGVPYSSQLNANGGQAPYTWSFSPGSAGLPAGLNLTSDGRIIGTPTGPGNGTIYDFSIRVTDSVNAHKDVAFTITVF